MIDLEWLILSAFALTFGQSVFAPTHPAEQTDSKTPPMPEEPRTNEEAA